MITRIFTWIKSHPIWSALIGLFALYLAYAMFWPAKPEYSYITETVERGDVQSVVSASGKLRALNTINVGAEVSGQVTQVNVDFNSQVKAGQVLAVIDQTRVRAREQQGRASVALAQASLQQANANIARARADLAIQQREYARRKTLADRGFLSKAALDQAETQLVAARSSVEIGATQAASARAQISQASAELSSSQLDLSRTKIIAPSSGVIINKLVEPGSTVTAGFQTPNLFEIAADITQMQVEASVDEADIGQVREGQNVTFTVDSYPDEKFSAKVRQVRQAPLETQNVVSYLVIIDVANLDGKLLPGMTANVEIITGAKQNVMRVPTSALRFQPRKQDLPEETQDNPEAPKKDEKQPAVFVATSDPYRPAKRPIKLGIRGDEYTEVIEGVKVGDKILLRTKSLKPRPEPEETSEEDDAAS